MFSFFKLYKNVGDQLIGECDTEKICNLRLRLPEFQPQTHGFSFAKLVYALSLIFLSDRMEITLVPIL